jgi:hypothetical protein
VPGTNTVIWNPVIGYEHFSNAGRESPAAVLFHELRHIAEGVFSSHPGSPGTMDPVVAETNRFLAYSGQEGRVDYYDAAPMTFMGPRSTESSTRSSEREWPYAW